MIKIKMFMSESTNIRLTKAQYDELVAFEVDTLGDDSPKEKFVLAKALENAKKMSKGYSISLNNTKYLKSALDNARDIAQDNGNTRLANGFTKLMEKL